MIQNLNKSFENRIRLGVMSILMVNDEVDFNTVKELLDATDGNVASHTSALEESGYISVRKKFVGKKPHTSYRITAQGRKAFQQHIDALEKLIHKGKSNK